MTKKEYLAKLYHALVKVLDENQAQNIVEDYDEFFDTGMAEGEDEHVLADRFGPPEKLALELVSAASKEGAGLRATPAQNVKVQDYFSTMLLLGLSICAMGIGILYRTWYADVAAVFVPAIVLAYWLKQVSGHAFFTQIHVKRLAYGAALLLILLGFIEWINRNGYLFWYYVLAPGKRHLMALQLVGPSANGNLMLLRALGIAAIGLIFYNAAAKYRHWQKAMIPIVLLLGLLQTVSKQQLLLHSLTNLDAIKLQELLVLTPLLWAMLLAAVLFFACRRGKRG